VTCIVATWAWSPAHCILPTEGKSRLQHLKPPQEGTPGIHLLGARLLLGTEAPEELLHCPGLQNLLNSRLAAAEDAFMTGFYTGQTVFLCVRALLSVVPESV